MSGEPLPGSDRRQITVMFCDLVGSTVLANTLYAEDCRAVIRCYEQTCAEVAAQFDGHLSNVAGDDAIFTFGYPQAGENDAERAVLVGLEMARVVTALKPIEAIELQGRVGVSTSLVVTDHGRFAGDTPAMAARLQHVANPGQVVIAASTLRLVGGLFHLTDLGEHDL